MNLKEWFDSFTYEKILSMKGNEESQILDCKQVGEEKRWKPTLGVVISGFSNAEGGICLWGVDARKNEKGVDCITGFPGISDAKGFASRLNELTPAAVSPGVPGVEHRALVRSTEDDFGFVATYVAASDRGPHMARFGEDRYMQRIGLSFLRMEHFQIADMFGRRARPDLQVSYFNASLFEFRIKISNIGRAAARGVFIQLFAPPPFKRSQSGVDGNGTEQLPFIKGGSTDGSWLHAGGANDLLHPTMQLNVGGVWLGYSDEVQKHHTNGNIPTVLQISYKVGALDIQPQQGILEITLPILSG